MRLQNKEQHFVSVFILTSPPLRGQKLNKPPGGGLNRAFTVLIMSFFEIIPVGFTRRSRVYRCDAIRFQGLDAILCGWMDWLCGTDSLDRMW